MQLFSLSARVGWRWRCWCPSGRLQHHSTWHPWRTSWVASSAWCRHSQNILVMGVMHDGVEADDDGDSPMMALAMITMVLTAMMASMGMQGKVDCQLGGTCLCGDWGWSQLTLPPRWRIYRRGKTDPNSGLWLPVDTSMWWAGCLVVWRWAKTSGLGNVKACVVINHSHQTRPKVQKKQYRETLTQHA